MKILNSDLGRHFFSIFSLLPRQCDYFCLASQMALLGFLFSYHLMPWPGFELTSVELAPLCGTLIQDRITD